MLVTCLMAVIVVPGAGRRDGAAARRPARGADVFERRAARSTYQHLFWFYGHPVVYVMFFPFLGAVAEVVATFSRKRFFGYNALVLSLLALHRRSR